MPLIASISGIRGTVGGRPGSGLTPPDIVRFTSAYGQLVLERNLGSRCQVVVGRDARCSGPLVSGLVVNTLLAMGIDVTDLGLATTPTVELAVPGLGAQGGIILTASHNPAEWNALKLLGPEGEFLSAADGERMLELAGEGITYAGVEAMGRYRVDDTWLDRHIRMILDLPLVDQEAIRKAGYRIAVDPVNSVGAHAVPALLRALGMEEIMMINGDVDGHFAHNPEPLPDHLHELAEVTRVKADLGIAVDPDVDRLALVCEDGSFFGEEYTLVAVADYVLQHHPGNTVSNLSSSRALADITERAGGRRFASAVGEVNVVRMMKEVQAVIGGEGNGGVIYPALHYGRDALAGIALFLSHLARSGVTASALRASYPDYHISKTKVSLPSDTNMGKLLEQVAQAYDPSQLNLSDGVWVDLGQAWLHLRRSNTEPIIRIYAEARTQEQADRITASAADRIRAILPQADHQG